MDNFATLLLGLNNSMKERVEFWGCDVSKPEGIRTAETLFIGTFPSILIIGLQNNQQIVLYRTITSQITFEELQSKVTLGKYRRNRFFR